MIPGGIEFNYFAQIHFILATKVSEKPLHGDKKNV